MAVESSYTFDTDENKSARSRRRRIAEALMMQGMKVEPLQSPWQGAAKIAQSLMGGIELGLEDRREREMMEGQRKADAEGLARLDRLGGGAGPTPRMSVAGALMPPDEVKSVIDANVPEGYRDYAYRMAQKESNFNPTAVSPTGARGLFQFTGRTGKSYGLLDDEGDYRNDPVRNTRAFVQFTEDNRSGLRRVLGREPTLGELALAHQQGLGGATALLTGQGTVDPRNLAVQAGNPKNAADVMRYYGFAPDATAPGPIQVAQGPSRTMNDGTTQELMAIATDPRMSPTVRERAKLMLQSMPKPVDPIERENKILQNERLRREVNRPDLSGVEVMRDPTTGEIVRVDKATGQASVVRPGQASQKAPETRVVKQPDGSEVALQWDPEAKSWKPMNAPEGGNPVSAPLKLTEQQSKDAAFVKRSERLIPRLEKQDEALLDNISATGGRIPLVGNYLKTPEYRQAEQTARELLAVILRKDTGAAVTDQEMSLYGWIYLPQPGDDKDTIIQKREGRKSAIDGLRRGLGGLDIILDQRDALLDKQRATATSGASAKSTQKGPPAGVTAAEWKAMTDEERALWK